MSINEADKLIFTHKGSPNSLVKNSLLKIPPGEREFSVTDLKEYLENEHHLVYGIDYTEGNLANSIYFLTGKGFFSKTGRGIYKRIANPQTREISPRTNISSSEKELTEPGDKIKNVQMRCEKNMTQIKESVNDSIETLEGLLFIDVRTEDQRKMVNRFLNYYTSLQKLIEQYENNNC